MLLILDLGIKTVVERNEIFCVWNLGCVNLFFFFFLPEKKKKEKDRVEAFHSKSA